MDYENNLDEEQMIAEMEAACYEGEKYLEHEECRCLNGCNHCLMLDW